MVKCQSRRGMYWMKVDKEEVKDFGLARAFGNDTCSLK